MVTLYIVAALFLCGIARAITINDCPGILDRTQYLQVYGDQCYYFFLQKVVDYGDAESTCHAYGGNLAMVKSKDTNRFLHEQLSYTYSSVTSLSGGKVWIGLTDLGKEGTFKWADGSPLKYQNWDTLEGPDAPFFHVLARIEDCVAMDPITGKWSDYKCESGYTSIFDEQRPFICQYDAEEHPPTTVAPSPIVDITVESTIETTGNNTGF